MDKVMKQTVVEIRFIQWLMTVLGWAGLRVDGRDAPHRTAGAVFCPPEALLPGVTDMSMWRKEGISECDMFPRVTSRLKDKKITNHGGTEGVLG